MNNIQDCYGVNKDGHFTLGGADTVALAKKYGTPLYLLDENKIRRQCEIYREAIKAFSRRLNALLCKQGTFFC